MKRIMVFFEYEYDSDITHIFEYDCADREWNKIPWRVRRDGYNPAAMSLLRWVEGLVAKGEAQQIFPFKEQED